MVTVYCRGRHHVWEPCTDELQESHRRSSIMAGNSVRPELQNCLATLDGFQVPFLVAGDKVTVEELLGQSQWSLGLTLQRIQCFELLGVIDPKDCLVMIESFGRLREPCSRRLRDPREGISHHFAWVRHKHSEDGEELDIQVISERLLLTEHNLPTSFALVTHVPPECGQLERSGWGPGHSAPLNIVGTCTSKL